MWGTELKKIITIVFVTVTLLVSFNLLAQSGIRTKNYKCSELLQLVQAEKQLSVRGFFGSTQVFSSPRSCGRNARAVRANWRTLDKTFCAAGFTCSFYSNDDD